jgi:tyrosinase
MEKWRDEFYRVAQQGFYVDERGNRVPFNEATGIDIIGNIMESSILSPNRRLYGDLHNFGHLVIRF